VKNSQRHGRATRSVVGENVLMRSLSRNWLRSAYDRVGYGNALTISRWREDGVVIDGTHHDVAAHRHWRRQRMPGVKDG